LHLYQCRDHSEVYLLKLLELKCQKYEKTLKKAEEIGIFRLFPSQKIPVTAKELKHYKVILTELTRVAFIAAL